MAYLDRIKHILLVEDLPSHQDLIVEALDESKIPHKLHIVDNGEEALLFLLGKTPYVQVPKPDLILLDLNMPRMDGRELLATIKQDVELKLIPVVVFTTSNAPKDITESYALQANSYITKPSNLDQFFQAIEMMITYWFTIVTLPPK